MKIKIQATKSDLTLEEIRNELTPKQLARVKGKVLTPYIIAEEGVSKPRVIGEGSKILNWSREVIQKVKNKVQSGLKLYHGHNEDNSTNNRKSVGEVVTSLTKEVGGRLQTIAIACMNSLENSFDVCSIEADVFEENGNVSDVETISGIAVANSQVEQPAFNNARRLIPVQFFNSEEELQEPERIKTMNITYDDLMNVPLDMFKKVAKAKEIHPAQIFDLSDIENDREFGSLISDKKTAETKFSEMEIKFKALTEETENSKKELIKTTAKTELEKFIPKELTEGQKNFITTRFDAEKLESLDEGILKTHIDNELTAYKDYAKMFGNENSSEVNDNKLELIEDSSNDDETTAFEKAFENDE